MIAGKSPAYFVIEKDGTAIGTAGMHHDNEIGFLLHPDYWRQGIVSEAMETIIPHIWQTTSVDTLVADVDPRNTASMYLLTSLGFTETHRKRNTFHINGVWSDSVYFQIKYGCT